MSELHRWHELEEADPEIFGRMHGVFLTKSESEPVRKLQKCEKRGLHGLASRAAQVSL